MNLFVEIILAITVIVNLILFFLIIRKSKKSWPHKIFALNIIGIMGWALSVLLIFLYKNNFIAKFIYAFPPLGMMAQLLFIKKFAQKSKKFNIFYYWDVLTGLIFTFLSLVPGIIINDIKVTERGYAIITYGSFYIFYSMYMLYGMIYSVIALRIKYKKEKDNEIIRYQLYNLFYGYLFFLVAVFTTNLILPFFFKIYIFNGVGPFMSMVLIVFVFYIITRYRFLDIGKFIIRSLIYTLLLSITVVFYLATVFTLGKYFQANLQFTYNFSAILVILAGIFGVPILNKIFTKLTDKVFFKNAYNYSKALDRLTEILNFNLELKDIKQKINEETKNIFKTNRSCFVVFDNNNKEYNEGTMECSALFLSLFYYYRQIIVLSEMPYMQKLLNYVNDLKISLNELEEKCWRADVEVAVPISLQDNILGVLLLGSKRSGDLYSTEDLSLLKTFSNEAAIALEKARYYEKEKEHAEELEKKVKQRTRKIKALQEEQKNLMLDISHALQTPLTIVKSELESMEMQFPENDKLRKFNRKIDQASKMVYDLLSLAKMEKMEDDLCKERINLSELLEDMIEYFNVLVQEQNIAIKKNIGPNIHILGTKNKIEEMIINIVSNSIKYIDNKRIIEISLSEESSKAILKVADTGIGMSEESIKNIFKRFYRGEDEPARTKKGTGLGLAIVEKIVEKHEGEIFVTSELGKGTTISVKFNIEK